MTKKFKSLALLCAFSTLGIFGCADTSSGTNFSSVDSGTSAPPIGNPDPGNPDPGNSATIYGVTIDQVGDVPAIVDSLSKLAFKPTTRIVFDEGTDPSYYANATQKIHEVSHVMGEILDSFYMKDITTAQYLARTQNFMNTLGDNVDIWEIGNEINGEWLGSTTDVAAKMTASYNEVKSRGKKTALTLYYNEDCWANKNNEMFLWAQNNVNEAMKQGLDYVWISYYEDDCNDLQPDWPAVFKKLSAMFPNSKIGFGEAGTKYADRKIDYMNRYYDMQIDVPNYVGGYFWWYFYQDCIPSTKPLWAVFNKAIQ